MEWNKIERDSIGNASESCLDEMFSNLPIEIYTEEDTIILVDSEDLRVDVKMSIDYTYWRSQRDSFEQ